MKTKLTNHSIAIAFMVAVVTVSCNSCKKFLDEKPDSKLATITGVKDIQALLDNYLRVNENDQAVTQICSDDSYLPEVTFNARKESERNLYVWAPASVFEPSFNAWTDTYGTVYIANLALDRADALSKNPVDPAGLAAVRGQALFHRGREFLQAVSVWCVDYDKATAVQSLGIPMPLSPDFNIPSARANLEESFQQIISDLKAAIPLLPNKSITPLRPSKTAAYGLLARVLLYKDDFLGAGKYADSCLQGNSKLIDFNTLNPAANFPISKLNGEVSFESKMVTSSLIVQSRAFIEPSLYALYPENDLRKTIFFKMGASDWVFKGNYEGDGSFFNGISTNEILLIRAECAARNGDLTAALADLNLLRKNRIKASAYTALTAGTGIDALQLIKRERRMELPFRGLRWMDIKRWNSEGDGIILTRRIGQASYTLEPKSLRYAIAIPEDLIQLSRIPQNPR